MLGVHKLKIGQGCKCNVIRGEHLLPRISKIMQISRIHRLHKGINDLLCLHVRRNIRCDWNQLIVGYLPATIRFLYHGNRPHPLGVFSRRYNVSIPIYHRRRQPRVGMPADDQIQIGDTLCENLILRLALVPPRSAVGDTDDHINILRLPNLRDGLFYCFHRIFENQLARRRTFQRICAEDTDDRDIHAALVENHVVFNAVLRKAFREQLLSFAKACLLHRLPIHVADDKLRQNIPAVHRAL